MTIAQAGPDPLAEAHRALLAERYGPPVRAWHREAVTPQRAALNRAVLATVDDDEPPAGGGHEGSC